MMFGLPKNAPITELVKAARKVYSGRLPPVTVATGPVKENIIKGDDIDLLEFPVPQWHRARRRPLHQHHAGHGDARIPCPARMNVGIYRGMIGKKNTIPVLMWRPRYWASTRQVQRQGHKEMPIAFAIGWEPCLPFCAASPVPKDVCEYDVMGAMRGAPVELVKCETVDLQVPACAEIVIEG